MQPISAGKVRGIDVSHHNDVVNWGEVKQAGYSFVYVKATEGVTYTDPMYTSHMQGAKQAGLLIGVYHFARPDHNDAVAEAQHFVDALKMFKMDLMPVLDLEVPTQQGASPGYLVTWVRDFVEYVKRATGFQVMLYTGIWYIRQNSYFDNQLCDLPLWVSLYNSSVPDAGGWTTWTAWQYSDQGNVPGINGVCDLDVAVSLDSLAIVPMPTPAPKPAPKPTPTPPPTFIPLKVRVQGAWVKKLQLRLGITADGIFGPRTEATVKEFQRAHGLVVDGIVGPKTWHALFG